MKLRGLTLTNFKTYSRDIVVTECGISQRGDKQVSGREQRLEIDPHKYSQLIFDKKAKTIQQTKNILFINGAGTTECAHAKKKIIKNLGTDLILFTIMNSV